MNALAAVPARPAAPALPGLCVVDRPVVVYIVVEDDGLRADCGNAVRGSSALRLAGSTGSVREALHDLQRGVEPDVVLVDLELPEGGGAGVIRHLRQLQPQARALVVSAFSDDRSVVGALSARAQGYLLKGATEEEVLRAIREVARGDAPLAPPVARYLLRPFGLAPAVAATPVPEQITLPAGLGRLTVRETEILTLVAQGRSGCQVAAQLGLSLHTVNTHLRNCHAKLQARNRQQAVSRARLSGQIA